MRKDIEPEVGKKYKITQIFPDEYRLAEGEYEIVAEDERTFSVKGPVNGLGESFSDGARWQTAGYAFEEVTLVPEVGKKYHIAPHYSYCLLQEGDYAIKEIRPVGYGSDVFAVEGNGDTFNVDFYTFTEIEEGVQVGKAYDIGWADPEDGGALLPGRYTISRFDEAEDEFAVEGQYGSGYMISLYTFTPVEPEAGAYVTANGERVKLEVGKRYKVTPAQAWCLLSAGEYEITKLSDRHFNVDPTYDGWQANLERYTFTPVEEAVEEPEPKVDQEQLDALYELAYDKGRAQGAKELRAAYEALGFDVSQVDNVIAAAKAARLAYWEAIGNPRHSEPKEISLAGWIRALDQGVGKLKAGGFHC